MSTIREPINTSICTTAGTIFSSNGGGGGTGPTYTFSNIGGAIAFYAQNILNNIQFRTLAAGASGNVKLNQGTSVNTIDVPDLAFNSVPAVKRAIPGLQGVVLGQSGILATLQALLYPTLPPTVGISLNQSQFEYGDSSPLTANWNVNKTDEVIQSINVNGLAQTPTGNNQSGSLPISKTGLASITVPIQATTATQSANGSATATVGHKIRFGGTLKDGIVNQILDSDINALTSVFANAYQLPVTSIPIASNSYLIIEIPISLLESNTPQFRVNGFLNNAFALVRAASNFTNSFGYTEIVNVYVSNSFATGTIQLEID